MKHSIRKLGYCMLLLLFYAMSSCEKDLYENQIQQQGRHISYLKGQQAVNAMNHTTTKMNTSKNKHFTNKSGDVFDFGKVKYDVVMQYIDEFGNVNNTYKVESPEANSKEFFNLLEQQKIDGSYVLKLMDYTMTPEFAEKYNKGEKPFSEFQGGYTYRLIAYNPGSHQYDPSDGGGEGGGGGGGGGSNDGNTPHPIGSSPSAPGASQGSNNNSQGAGAIGGGSSGSPCESGSGGIGDAGSDGGGSGDGGGGSEGQISCSFVVSISTCNGGGGHTGEGQGCIGSDHGGTIIITLDCSSNHNKNNHAHKTADDSPCSGGTGSGGGGVFPPDPNLPTPCDQLKEAGDPTKLDMKPSVDWLKAKLQLALEATTKEFGVVVEKHTNANGDGFNYPKQQKFSSSNFSVDLSISGTCIGSAHSHPFNGVSIPSFGDVKWLLDCYNQTTSSRQADVFMMVVCQNNNGTENVYAMKINDFDKLTAEVNAKWDSNYEMDNDDEKMYRILHKESILYKDSNNVEKTFLQEFNNYGIDLYKATDDSLNHWNKLDLSPDPANPAQSIVTETPC